MLGIAVLASGDDNPFRERNAVHLNQVSAFTNVARVEHLEFPGGQGRPSSSSSSASGGGSFGGLFFAAALAKGWANDAWAGVGLILWKEMWYRN